MTTAIDIDTGRIIAVKPIAIRQSDACGTLLMADADTGKGPWMGYGLNWRIDPECGNLSHDAERIEGVYGADENEWEAAADRLLADCGFKPDAFDEEAGDRYGLVEA